MPQTVQREGFPGQHLFVLPPSLLAQARRHPLLQGLFLTAAGYYPEAPRHFVERPDGAPEMILIACISGRGWLKLEQGRIFPVPAGEFALIPPGTAHAYGADAEDPWSIMWAHFRGNDLPSFMQLLKVTATDQILRVPAEVFEQLQFEQLYLLLENGSTLVNILMAGARLRLIVTELIKSRMPSTDRARSTGEALRQNIDWMRVHCHQRTGLPELAKQAGLSVPHYCALFKRRTGYSPMNYFQRLKIQHACRSLALTDLPVDEIAKTMGFDDPFYFSRLFKKIMGHSPRAFRKHRKD